jgi:hypothetical protein
LQSLKNRSATEERFYENEGVAYFPQLEQEQSAPQLPIAEVSIGESVRVGKNIQLEEPEHPHSPFMMIGLIVLMVAVRS